MNVRDALNKLTKQDKFDARMHHILDEKFVKLNLNPNNENIGDCVIRAIAKAYNIKYEDVVNEFKNYNLLPNEDGDQVTNFAGLWYNLSRIMEHYGYEDYIEGYLLDRPMVRDFIKDHPTGTYIIGLAKPQHLTVVVDGTLYDTWDCTGKIIEEVWVINKGKLDEDFPDKEHRIAHFQKHCVDNDLNEFSKKDFRNDKEYEEAANKLALTRVDSSDLKSNNNVIGFIQDDGAFVKYDKTSQGLVKYKPDRRFGKNVKIITFYKATPNRYQHIKDKQFGKEIK